MATAARDDEHDGILPQLFPLHGAVRHARERTSILKLGALEGLLGLKGSMTWTVTQKLGGQSRTLSFSSVLAQLSFFQREMYAGVSLFNRRGRLRGWVHRGCLPWHFFTQGIVFVIFSLRSAWWRRSTAQPPSSKRTRLAWPQQGARVARLLALRGERHLDRKPRRKSRTQLGGIQTNGDLGGGARSNGSDEGEVSTEEEDAAAPIAIGGKRAPSVAPPPLWRVLRANVVIFLTPSDQCVLDRAAVRSRDDGPLETIHTQWDDIVALSLSLYSSRCICAGARYFGGATGKTAASHATVASAQQEAFAASAVVHPLLAPSCCWFPCILLPPPRRHGFSPA